ncbi:CRACD-like protein [Eulemur rufifrons]|uniref:CRACD-like protein n=1 Tax=Eulemur rufifrons TaxID=859984 RepID=UPI003743B733
MISTRVMDIKLREAAEGLGEDSTGKKKSKFKTFKKFFGKKKRKESPSSTGSSTWKQSQARTEVIAVESGPVGYDSEDELEESRGTLGSRALSHDSIFIPESGQDPARPVRVFSQENVSDRIKALQLKIQCNVKMGPPPPPGVLPAKRGEDAGMSSEDDGLPRSPPEMSLLHDVGPGPTIKASPLSLDHANGTTASPRNSDGSLAPVADFSHPAESSSCLDNSAAKHKLLVKPRNQRSSKMRRLSSRAQSECLSDLTWTLEEEEFEEKPLPQALKEESPSSVQQDVVLGRGPGLGPLATLLQPGGARARRARLQHSPAVSASMEEGSSPGHEPSSSLATPEVTEPVSVPVSSVESPSLPEGSLHPSPEGENQEEVLSTTGPSPQAADAAKDGVCASEDASSPLSTNVPEEDTTPPETVTAVTLETPAGPDRPDQDVPDQDVSNQDVPDQDVPDQDVSNQAVPDQDVSNQPEGARKEALAAPSPSPPPPKSCLKRRASAASTGLGGSPAGSPLREPGPCALDREAAPPERPKAEQVESPQGDRAAPERKTERGGGEARGAKKFSVSSCRGRPRQGSSRLQEHPGASSGRLPLGRSGPAWRSEAALDDLQGPPEPQSGKPDPQKAAEGDSQDSGNSVAGPTTPGAREPCPAAKEPSPGEDRNPFPVKLRSTSLSLKYRDSSAQEARGVKRYSAEVRLERGLTLLPKDEKSHVGTAAALRGARSPSDQGKGKARSPEQLSSKPPLPRKPLLQSLTLPHSPAPPDASPREPEPRKEKRSLRRGAEKGLPPAATGPGANGQPAPPWITVARQKRRGASDQPPNQEDKSGARTPKPELGKQAKPPERAQDPVKHMDFVRSKSFLITPAKPPLERRRGVELSLQEGLQRGISLSHQNLAQSAGMTEKELHQLKRASYASADQPSWMELARKKSQAWSDMPQIIK